MDNNTVLLIEDDPKIASIIAINLKDKGLLIEHVADGETGLKLAQNKTYAVIILDIMIPRLDGMSVCKNIRKKDSLTPILMLTARAGEADRIRGLEIGADDYMVKPFSIKELLARVGALIRRSQATDKTKEEELPPSKIGDLTFDFQKRQVFLNNTLIELTVKEFELLRLFFRNPGRAFSRSDLLNHVWGQQFEGYEHTVNTNINRLRNKIEKDPAHPKYLKTVWGVGYRFAEGDEFK
ncbi:MAG: DNA-binding response regulator [Treponema sp. CETP13]|nr:MAG: DNA-binding response regulator [Treponema sp. CETP13]